jgi:hypothetical protein
VGVRTEPLAHARHGNDRLHRIPSQPSAGIRSLRCPLHDPRGGIG